MKTRKGMVRYIASTGSRATRYGVPVGAGHGQGQADAQGPNVGGLRQDVDAWKESGSCSKVRFAQAVETNRGLETQAGEGIDAVQSGDKCLKVREIKGGRRG